MQTKSIVCHIAAISFIVVAAGCGSKSPPVPSPTVSTFDQELIEAETVLAREAPLGFARIDEAFGGESMLDYRLTPSEVVLGEPVEIEVHTGSSYGPVVDVQVMVRTTDGSRKDNLGYLANAMEGGDWTDVAAEGIYVQVAQDGEDESEEIRFEPNDSSHEEYAIENLGHTRFVASVTPTVEKPVVELRWYSPEMEEDLLLRMIADQAIQVYPAND